MLGEILVQDSDARVKFFESLNSECRGVAVAPLSPNDVAENARSPPAPFSQSASVCCRAENIKNSLLPKPVSGLQTVTRP